MLNNENYNINIMASFQLTGVSAPFPREIIMQWMITMPKL